MNFPDSPQLTCPILASFLKDLKNEDLKKRGFKKNEGRLQPTLVDKLPRDTPGYSIFILLLSWRWQVLILL